MGCWHGYLSGTKGKLFAYGPADATATPSSLVSLKSRMVLPSWCQLTQVVLEKRPLNGCSVVVKITHHGEKLGWSRFWVEWYRYSVIFTGLIQNCFSLFFTLVVHLRAGDFTQKFQPLRVGSSCHLINLCQQTKTGQTDKQKTTPPPRNMSASEI